MPSEPHFWLAPAYFVSLLSRILNSSISAFIRRMTSIALSQSSLESRSWRLDFSPDGKRLFALEQTVQFEGETAARYATPRLRSIDIERAAIQSEIVPTERVLWTTVSPDGGGLYVLFQGQETAPRERYRLVRLEAVRLVVTASRALDEYREMRVLVPRR